MNGQLRIVNGQKSKALYDDNSLFPIPHSPLNMEGQGDEE